jgi:hypothetical protein
MVGLGEQHPDAEQCGVNVDERHRPRESGDPISDPQLKVRGPVHHDHEVLLADPPAASFACHLQISSDPNSQIRPLRRHQRLPSRDLAWGRRRRAEPRRLIGGSILIRIQQSGTVRYFASAEIADFPCAEGEVPNQ